MEEQIFCISKDLISCPRTPTLPGLQENSPHRKQRRQRNLKIITTPYNILASPAAKTTASRRVYYNESAVRRNLQQEYEKFSENSGYYCSEAQESPNKINYRSMSTSANDKCKHYLNEIYTLNNKIRNLIREQDSLRDKLFTQEGMIMNLQKGEINKPVLACHEIQSATIPQHESFDSDILQVTFKPQEQWIQPKSRKFPREIFGKVSKPRLSY